MTKIDIFSGFLGAGKTTLIKKLIKEAYNGEKLVLITDCTRAGGMPDGEYTLGGQKIFVNGIECLLEDGTIAGSTLYFDNIYQKIKNFVPFKDFIGYASRNIAQSIGLNINCKVEKDADDFIIWDKKDFKTVFLTFINKDL